MPANWQQSWFCRLKSVASQKKERYDWALFKWCICDKMKYKINIKASAAILSYKMLSFYRILMWMTGMLIKFCIFFYI